MSRKENRREDHKRLRAAEKQALRGGHHRVVRPNTWSRRPDETPLLDGPSTGKKRSKSKWCKGKVGQEHDWHYVITHTHQYGDRAYHYYRWVCSKCKKHSWRTPKSVTNWRQVYWPNDDHFTTARILRRLYGDGKCDCSRCKDSSA